MTTPRQSLTFLAALLLVACDAPDERQRTRAGQVLDVELAADLGEDPPADCRAAHFCYADCLGAAFLAGETLVDEHAECVASCEPADNDAAHQFGWWVDALELACEGDWSDACLVPAVRPNLTNTLEGTTLYACFRQGV